jgi:voltage-gated sodium channel
MSNATLDLETANSRFEAAIESRWFRYAITGLIIVNAVVLGILTYDEALPPDLVVWLDMFDQAVTIIFAVEILFKLIVYRLRFFTVGWNWFDFTVVGISLLPGAQVFTVLRALRVLRILRLLHIMPMLRRITEALLGALPGMGAILAVLALLTYVGAVMATVMFGNTDNEEVLQLFGSLPASAYSLFQVMTMDGWRFEVVQKVIDDGNPYAPLFFLAYIFIASFAVLNLFIALIVDALAASERAAQQQDREHMDEEFEEADREREEILQRLREIQAELVELRKAKTPDS